VNRLVPGVALAAALAAVAFGLRRIPALASVSPLMLAILVGMAWRNVVGVRDSALPGIAASVRAPLRFGIVLLGLQLTVADIMAVGGAGVAVIVLVVAATYAFTVFVGRQLGVDGRLARLVAVGTAICGASAIIAANTVVRDRDAGVAYALGVVTLFGTVVMLAFPLIGDWLALGDRDYGLWIGATVHEVPQVVAAAFAHGDPAGQMGTMSKLTRVLALAPMVLAMAWVARRREAHADAQVPVPWFVFGFLAMVLVASAGVIPAPAKPAIVLVTQAILALSLAAVGLATDFRHIAARGWRALALGAASTVFIGVLGLLLVRLFPGA
jgi:uncharacterized integral membrane protein (TIGR00698 family)